MKTIFEEYQVPYYLLNSSSTGFHFIIPHEYFNEENVLKNIDTFRDIIFNLKGIYSFQTLDTSITDLKRIKKVPYGVVSDQTISLPLNDDQFNRFSQDKVKIDYVLKNIFIKNRGLLLRHYGLSKLELQKNVSNFIKEFK
jgi:hypothetical protein